VPAVLLCPYHHQSLLVHNLSFILVPAQSNDR
jgi:hypothetical protein